MRFVKYFLIIFVSSLLGLYGLLFLFSLKTYPVEFGISFNQDHAQSLGLDWKKTYLEMLTDLKPKYIRIAAMWSDVETTRGKFDFANVDFMMNEAAKNNTKVVLVVGQKAPRWPECHVPDWYKKIAATDNTYLSSYISETVKRYAHHPALEIWQVENEPFINFKFGDCLNYRPELVPDEVVLVKNLDPNHKIMITDSGELSTWYHAVRAADIFGTTLYRVVRTPGGTYFYYDWLPAGFYHLKAKLFGLNNENFFIAELQAEPWFTDSDPTNTPITEQEKSMNPDRLQKHLDYVTHIGSSRTYLWGVEWWAFMKEKKNDGRYWEMVKERLKN